MATKKEVQSAKLVDEYLAGVLAGKAMDMQAYLKRCPPDLREEVRLALEGVGFLVSSYEPLLMKSGGAEAVGRRIAEAIARQQRLGEMEERAGVQAALGRPIRASDALGWLSRIVGISLQQDPQQPARQVAPVLLYRNREAGALLEREQRDRLQAAALLSRAERVARRFLDEAGVTEPPISPYEVARMHGILVTEQATKGCDGCVLIEGDSAAVLVNAAIESEERRRFTVAHELGHVALHGDLLQFRREALDEIERETDSGIEAEANAFASELLMPAEFVDREFARQVPSFSVAEAMQTRFRVSFTAAALRLVKRSHHSCALVFTKDGTVVWMARSPEWRRYYVPTGTTPHEGTVTAGLLQGEEPARKRYPTLASYWAPDHRADGDAVVVEEVRRGHAGSILTLLYDQDA